MRIDFCTHTVYDVGEIKTELELPKGVVFGKLEIFKYRVELFKLQL